MKYRAAALAATVLTLIAFPATAQAPAAHGVVIHAETGQPIAGATVDLPAYGLQVVTGEDGTFRLPPHVATRVTLRVRRLGFAPSTLELTPADLEAPLTVTLAPAPLQLEAIEVLKSRTELGYRARDLPGSVHVVSRSDMEPHIRAVPDIHQMLRQVPGVVVQEEDAFGLRPNIGLRGTGSERSSKITVMEDGVLMAPAPYAAPAAYYFPLAGRMSAIEVRKGSSQIKYGPRTIGGAVNLLSTPIPDRLAFGGEVVGGESATRKVRVYAGDTAERFGWMVEGYHGASDGFKRLDGFSDGTGFGLSNLVGKFRVNSSPRAPWYQELQMKFGVYDEQSDETYLGLTQQDFQTAPLRRYAASQHDVMNAEHRQLSLRYFARPSASVDVTAIAYRNDFHRNWYKLQSVLGQSLSSVVGNPAGFPEEMAVLRGSSSAADALFLRANNRDYFAEGLQANVAMTVGDRVGHVIEVGARIHRDEEDRFQHQNGYRMDDGRMARSSSGLPGSQANRVSAASAYSWYIHDQITVGRWELTPGLRFEHIDMTRTDYRRDDPDRLAPDRVRDNSVTAWIPGVGVTYALGRDIKLFGGIHTGFGPPGPGADTATAPERSTNYELGFKTAGARTHADVTLFHSDYDNILGMATLATGDDGTGRQFNGGAVNVWGIEGALGSELLVDANRGIRLPLRAALTVTRATFGTSFESDYDPWGDVGRGDHLPYLPTWQLYGSAGIRTPQWHLTASSTFTSAMRTEAGQGPAEGATSAAWLLSAAVERQLGPWSAVFVSAQNLLNAHHVVARRPAGARPGLPRTVSAGFRVQR